MHEEEKFMQKQSSERTKWERKKKKKI